MQFLRYFRDTGASQALQKAMILLYKMPMRPPNLAEFFAEYLENGANDLIKLSCLQAELCYKQSETEDIQKRIQTLESEINGYESQGYGRREPTPPEEPIEPPGPDPGRFLLDHIEDIPKKPYDLLDRFLGDLDDAAKMKAMASQSSMSVDKGDTQSNYGEEEEAVEAFDILDIIDSKDNEEKREQEWKKDIKKFDPWGIVCTFQPTKEQLQKADQTVKPIISQPAGVRTSLFSNAEVDVNMSDMSLSHATATVDLEQGHKNYDSDDAETLAEIYHSFGFDSTKTDPENNEIPIGDGPGRGLNSKLLSVLQPEKFKMAEFLGWEQVHCTTESELKELEDPQPPQIQPQLKCSPKPPERTSSAFPEPNWTQFTENEEPFPLPVGYTDPCLNGIDFFSHISWQDKQTQFYKSGNDDSFLLQHDMARIARKFAEANEPGFLFEFYGNVNPADVNTAAECATCFEKKVPKKKVSKRDEATMFRGLEIDEFDCGAGEDCEENIRFGHLISTVPGKMTNWTKDYTEYPEESGPYAGEDGDIPGESDVSKFLEEFAPLTVTRSMCQCSDSTASGVSSRALIVPDDSKAVVKKKTLVQDPELSKIFKTSGGYAEDLKEWEKRTSEGKGQGRKSQFGKDTDGDTGDQNYINLEKEAKRVFRLSDDPTTNSIKSISN